MPDYHLFISYARADNRSPRIGKGDAAKGWVDAFHDHLKARHRRYAGRELRVFFDRTAIVEGDLWNRRLREGLRSSRLFLAFLSPAYIASQYCRWEWEEYLRHAHGLGGDRLLYFMTAPELEGRRGCARDRGVDRGYSPTNT